MTDRTEINGLELVVEFRPRIRTCHFFVKSINQPKTVEIKKTTILIGYGENQDLAVNVENLNIVRDSLSSLQMNQDSIYFLVRTNPDPINGSFHCELFINNQLNGSFSEIYKPAVQVEKSTSIFCRTCSKQLNKEEIIFHRLLPLPTSDGSDFFCHSTTVINLDPKEGDCFYGNYYFKLNPKYFLELNEGVINCENCSSWLGLREENSVTLWNSGIKFDLSETESITMQALIDFKSLIESLIKMDRAITCKLIFQSRFDENDHHYLLLWVMDKSLSLFVNDKMDKKVLRLKEIKVVKLMYTYEKSETEIVKQWKQDIRVIEEPISMPMMEEGIKSLVNMSNIIPTEFRKANQLSISYVIKE